MYKATKTAALHFRFFKHFVSTKRIYVCQIQARNIRINIPNGILPLAAGVKSLYEDFPCGKRAFKLSARIIVGEAHYVFFSKSFADLHFDNFQRINAFACQAVLCAALDMNMLSIAIFADQIT